jgi:putative membrane protein
MTLATGQLSPLGAQGTATVEADANIIREVTAGNLLEIRLGELARKKTTHPAVRGFADRTITDHTRMNQQWTALVGSDGRPINTGLGQEQIGEVRRLEKVPDTQFDREYMASMIRHHQENVGFFRNAANSARSDVVRELLAGGLPAVQQHLSLAFQVGGQVGAAPVVATNPTYPGGQAPPTTGQNPPPPTQNAPVSSEIAKADREDLKKDSKFIREAVADNTLEIRLAQLAESKSTNAGVRQLARRVLDDRTAMQNQWISMGSRTGMKLKPGMGRRHKDKVKRLEKTSGAEFDREYVTMQIQSNQDYVEYFQKEGRATHSAQVRNLAANDLPRLQQHLSQAKQVGTRLGIDTDAALRARNPSSYRHK